MKKRGGAQPAPERAARRGVEAARHLPRELPRADPGARHFATPSGEWVAWVAGTGVGGTGGYNHALLEAIRFARAEAAAVPLREILVGRGTFDGLADAELAELCGRATPLTAEPPTS
jgi:pyruvate/2-oxoglutarate dehydrogenase complex dihydrolipoamide acyltransferase (E2) component